MKSWLNTFAGYRHVVNEGRIDRFLEQFSPVDKDLGARVLDSVEFVSHEQINQGFREILNGLEGWSKFKNQRLGKWRFVPFTGSSGESGDAMIHKFRQANGLGSERYDELFIYRRDLLKERLTSEDTIVFLDDFSGTGRQATKIWEKYLHELLPDDPTIYLILVGINDRAVKKISKETDLNVLSFFHYNDRDNLFSDSCKSFTPAEKQIILKYCKRADNRYPMGSGDCGMVLVLAHNTPNNSIPILHTNHEKWEGLFRRND